VELELRGLLSILHMRVRLDVGHDGLSVYEISPEASMLRVLTCRSLLFCRVLTIVVCYCTALHLKQSISGTCTSTHTSVLTTFSNALLNKLLRPIKPMTSYCARTNKAKRDWTIQMIFRNSLACWACINSKISTLRTFAVHHPIDPNA
jgi:hypothetical protein